LVAGQERSREYAGRLELALKFEAVAQAD
jgi:hypothetical protein